MQTHKPEFFEKRPKINDTGAKQIDQFNLELLD